MVGLTSCPTIKREDYRKEDFFGETTEDFSEYDYYVTMISDDLILINVMVKDHPSVRSQLYGFQD